MTKTEDESVAGDLDAAARADAAPIVIALDGPSGSGKSTVGRHLARVYGLGYLDTGAMYRVVTWRCVEAGVDLDDADAVLTAARGMDLAMPLDPDAQHLRAGDLDITDAIRLPEISTVVSKVATNLGIRALLAQAQRDLIETERRGGWSGGRGIVAEGRDITTVVAPDADVRILLKARAEARLERRARELFGTADSAAVDATRDQVLRRDADDATVSEFHSAADGVLTLDSSQLTLAETLEAAERLVAHEVGLPR